MGQIPQKCFDSWPPQGGWSGGSPLFISNLETRVSKDSTWRAPRVWGLVCDTCLRNQNVGGELKQYKVTE